MKFRRKTFFSSLHLHADCCLDIGRHTPFRPVAMGKSGFTMIEVMITVAIISILFALAFPSMTNLISRNRTKAAARELKGILQKAKLEAIKQNTSCLVVFTVSAGSDAGSCITCISTDSDCADPGDQIISQLNFNTYKSVALTHASFSGSVPLFVFNSRGMPETTAGAMSAGRADITNTAETSYAFSVSMVFSGRIQIQ